VRLGDELPGGGRVHPAVEPPVDRPAGGAMGWNALGGASGSAPSPRPLRWEPRGGIVPRGHGVHRGGPVSPAVVPGMWTGQLFSGTGRAMERNGVDDPAHADGGTRRLRIDLVHLHDIVRCGRQRPWSVVPCARGAMEWQAMDNPDAGNAERWADDASGSGRVFGSEAVRRCGKVWVVSRRSPRIRGAVGWKAVDPDVRPQIFRPERLVQRHLCSAKAVRGGGWLRHCCRHSPAGGAMGRDALDDAADALSERRASFEGPGVWQLLNHCVNRFRLFEMACYRVIVTVVIPCLARDRIVTVTTIR
jgi:hypothetical protein